MKAVVYTEYGPPEVLRLGEVEKPTPKRGEVLVEIHAASANPLDWHFVRGTPFFLRLGPGLRRPKYGRLGADIAGRVAAVGGGVTIRTGGRYDLILDSVGNRSVSAYRRALNPRGACVVVGFTTLSHLLGVISLGAWASRTGSKKVGLMGTAKPNSGDLVFIGGLLERGEVVPVIDKRYPLSETAEAIRYLEQGHARGKVVVSVKPSGHL